MANYDIDLESLTTALSGLKELGTTVNGEITSAKSTLNNVNNYNRGDASFNVSSLSSNISHNLDTIDSNLTNSISNIISYSNNIGIFNEDDYSNKTATELQKAFEEAVSEGNTQKACWIFFKAKGLSDIAVAGIMGNIMAECSFNCNAVGDSGTSYGLIQWHNDRWSNLKNYCSQNNLNWQSLEGQLSFLWAESVDPNSSYGKSLAKNGFYNATDAVTAAIVFHDVVEKSNSSRDTVRSVRGGYASQYYQEYLNKYPTGATDSETWTSVLKDNGVSPNESLKTGSITTKSGTNNYSYQSSNNNSKSNNNNNNNSKPSSTPEPTVAPEEQKINISTNNPIEKDENGTYWFAKPTSDMTKTLTKEELIELEKYLETHEGVEIKLPELGKLFNTIDIEELLSKDELCKLLSPNFNYDSSGMAKLGERYVVCAPPSYGNVGDFIDVEQSNGEVIECIIGSTMNITSNTANEYGNDNGKNVLDFIVNSNYKSSTNNIIKNVSSISNKGNYWDYASSNNKFDKVSIKETVSFGGKI